MRGTLGRSIGGRGDTHSSRARDLADIAAIALQVDGIDGNAVIDALRREGQRRSETLPDGLPTTFELESDQAADWSRRWTTLIRQPPVDFEQALHVGRAFLDPVLNGTVGKHLWDALDQT